MTAPSHQEPNSTLESLRLSQISRPVEFLSYLSLEGNLLLAPPYQRGDVWCEERRRNLIRSFLRGIPIPSLIINDRFRAGWGEEMAVIDGRQRIVTILRFLRGELKVPAAWVGLPGEWALYTDLPLGMQRSLRMKPLAVCEGELRSLEEEREVFELVNFGGVAQGESDL